MRRRICLSIIGCSVLAALVPTPAAAAQDQEVSVRVRTTVATARNRLSGRVGPISAPETSDIDREGCVDGRVVRVSVKTARGFKPAGRAVTTADGAWSVRSGGTDGESYRIHIERSDFAYSPAYGELTHVTCLPLTVSGRVGPRGFRPLGRVLGVRVARGPSPDRTDALAPEARVGSQLAATGSDVDGFVMVALALMAAGVVLLLTAREPIVARTRSALRHLTRGERT